MPRKTTPKTPPAPEPVTQSETAPAAAPATAPEAASQPAPATAPGAQPKARAPRSSRRTRSESPRAESEPEQPAAKPARRSTTTRARKTPAAAQPAPAAVGAPPPAEPAAPQGAWLRIDLHMHTPGSADYEQPGVTYLDILQQAERRGLDIIAFTDHNTVNGYRQMRREIADLELLERLNRISPDEMGRLLEYRRLLNKILVLPGFEFTSTFGFHILGIFPPEKLLRDIEYLLMQMHVPGDALEQGLTEAGATSDVLTAYRLIDEAGGLAIAAHANSSSGVLMRGISIGGQTRIAFTQDMHLAAVELTDLNKGRRSMAYWLSGVKAEYPRRMHIIQGSDAHRLTTSTVEARRLGIGDRSTEVLLTEASFPALRAVFLSQDFQRTRPARGPLNIVVEPARDIRAEGPGATRAFHPALPKRGNRFDKVVEDVCAMANTDGGTIAIGCEPGISKKPAGVASAQDTAHKLGETIQARLSPSVPAIAKAQPLGDADIILVTVPQSDQAPHAVDNQVIYVRVDTETRVATRDEIVAVTRRSLEHEAAKAAQAARHRGGQAQPHTQRHEPQPQKPSAQPPAQPPRQQQQHPHGQPGQRPPPQQQQQAPQQAQQQQAQQPQAQQQQAQQQPKQQPQQQAPRSQQQAGHRRPAQPPGSHSTQPGARTQPVQPAPQAQAAPANAFPPAVEPEPGAPASAEVEAQSSPAAAQVTAPAPATPQSTPPAASLQPPLIEGMPRSGVQIATIEERDGIRHYTVRDLRNNILVRNVTLKSARDLWHYAIVQCNTNAYKVDQIAWPGIASPDEPLERVILGKAFRAGKMRYDLALRGRDGSVYVFYGVSEDGMDSAWRRLIAQDQAAEQERAAQAVAEPPSESDPA